MRVAIVSTYAPKACGIAVFSGDVRTAMLAANRGCRVDVVAMLDETAPVPTAPEVLTTVARNDPASYRAAARELTTHGIDVVVIEHEFGLFGGPAGEQILELADHLTQPLVVTLHTVLSEPSEDQLSVLRRLCRRAAITTVFTETARRMIAAQGIAPVDRVRVVPHGAPDILLSSRPSPDFPDRTVLSTFGLISAGKGIETTIAAMPAIVARHPDVLYLVVGRTHPDVVRSEGEAYRDGLIRLVAELGLDDHVRFLDRFADIGEIAQLLARTAVYLTPYRSREQIVSGALTFAVAAGCPVVSTPYFYAEDLLASGAGVLVPFQDADAFSAAVLDLLDHPDRLQAARIESRRIGSGLAWSQVAIDTLRLLEEAQDLPAPGPHEPEASDAPDAPGSEAPRSGTSGSDAPRSAASVRTDDWPELRLDHLLTLTDDVGVIEHAVGVVPHRGSGYCVDDVARLALVCTELLSSGLLEPGLGAGRQADVRRMLSRALAFLHHAYDPDAGTLRNRMAYDRRWADAAHDGDHVGRAVQALGAVLAEPAAAEFAGVAGSLLARLAPRLSRGTAPRAAAYGVLGLAAAPSNRLPAEAVPVLAELTRRLVGWHAGVRRPGWDWFEDYLTYDNARLSQALLVAGHRTGDEGLIEVGLTTLDWYVEQCDLGVHAVSLVGNTWRNRTAPPPIDRAGHHEGDEQPLDASGLTETLITAFTITGEHRYAELARRSFGWFLGRNRLGVPVYDEQTGGCHDGLGRFTLNDNQGAESTLAYLQAYLAVRGLPGGTAV